MLLKGDIGKLEVNILRRSYPNTDDYWDGNWLEAEVRIEVPGINVLYGINIRVDELQGFYEGILTLQKGHVKEAEFTTMEEGLYLHLELEPNGTINCNGKANNGVENSLDFRIETGLATLDTLVNECKVVLESYPLVGGIE